MDLPTIETVLRPRDRAALPEWRAGDACLAGGTWLFSEPQTDLRRLVDLAALGWPPHAVGEDGLTLAATCTLGALEGLDLPAAWIAAPVIGSCCRALLGSFKIRHVATVGGNLCLALPAGPVIALAVAMEATCLLWSPGGGERRVSALDFVLGPQRTALIPGEVLRSLHLPAPALSRRTAFRRVSLSPNGRSGALLIGTLARDGAFALTVTAAVRRPVRFDFPEMPGRGELIRVLDAGIPDDLIHDDVHGRPEWRRHMTRHLAGTIRDELAEAQA
jgi:CO/xanthine dehydrogenase FAD-binding subunit